MESLQYCLVKLWRGKCVVWEEWELDVIPKISITFKAEMLLCRILYIALLRTNTTGDSCDISWQLPHRLQWIKKSCAKPGLRFKWQSRKISSSLRLNVHQTTQGKGAKSAAGRQTHAPHLPGGLRVCGREVTVSGRGCSPGTEAPWPLSGVDRRQG